MGSNPTSDRCQQKRDACNGISFLLSVGYEKDGFAFLIDGFELSEIIVVIRKANHHPQF